MLIELPSLIAFSGGIVLALILSGKVALRGALTSQHIVKNGQVTEGVVIRVWRPPMAGSFPRVYFEFQPHGSDMRIQGCHVDRRALSGEVTSLPAVGSRVTVRYLPENPARAVIARLVSRFSH
ncbi:MAG: DUF3592 domain-containing protein [Povalibacter sp.]